MTSNLREHDLNVFILITHSVCGALPLDFHFTESKISKTVIIDTTITALEWSGSLHAHSVPRSRAIVLGKIRTKRLKLIC